MQVTNTFGSFLVAALSASLAAGSVLPRVAPGGAIEIKRASNPGFSGRNGPAALARAYAKYGVEVPESLVKAAENVRQLNIQNVRRESGNVTATPDSGDLEYLVPVQIGTPAQTLQLDFDTGSSDLWVFSSETSASDASGHSVYTPSDSSSSKEATGSTWDISYGDGSTSSGDVYTDVVKVGSLSVQSQAVESAKKVSSQFASGNNDGLLGLAFSSINTVSPTPVKTWFDNIKGSLDSQLFVADLKHNEPGSYIFGAIPSAAGDVLYAPVDNSQGFWQFSTSYDGTDFDAIADTGTTLLLTSNAIVSSYYAQVDGATNSQALGGYVFSCDTDLPDFTFTVGDGEITVPGSLMNYGKASAKQCFGGIQTTGGLPFAILGDIALKAAYVVFDDANTQVGWAAK